MVPYSNDFMGQCSWIQNGVGDVSTRHNFECVLISLRPIWIWKCAFASVITNNTTYALIPNSGCTHYSVCQMTSDRQDLWTGLCERKDMVSELRPLTAAKYGFGLLSFSVNWLLTVWQILQLHVKSGWNQNRSPIISINLLLAFNFALPSWHLKVISQWFHHYVQLTRGLHWWKHVFVRTWNLVWLDFLQSKYIFYAVLLYMTTTYFIVKKKHRETEKIAYLNNKTHI